MTILDFRNSLVGGVGSFEGTFTKSKLRNVDFLGGFYNMYIAPIAAIGTIIIFFRTGCNIDY